MANSKSAKKRIRQNAKRALVNASRRTKVRTYIKKIEAEIANGNKEGSLEAFKNAQPIMQASVNKGIFHKNTISRKLSRLSRTIKALG